LAPKEKTKATLFAATWRSEVRSPACLLQAAPLLPITGRD